MSIFPKKKEEALPPKILKESTRLEQDIPYGVQLTAAWSWRLIVIIALLGVLAFAIGKIWDIVVPVLIAVLLTAALYPFVSWLRKKKIPKWLAIVISELGLILVFASLIYLAVWQVSKGFGNVIVHAKEVSNEFLNWLESSFLHISTNDIDKAINSFLASVNENAQKYASGALDVGVVLGHVVAGAILVLVVTLFLLIDGDKIWRWMVSIAPQKARRAIDGAGRTGWVSLTSWTRVQVIVALINAIGISVGAAILHLPFVLPIAIIVFVGSFIPFIGAIVTGGLAILIALLYNGWPAAIWMTLIVLAVNQIEGHVLQPLITGPAVKVHPLAVILAVLLGTLLGGIAGALIAVPTLAFSNAFIGYLRRRGWEEEKPIPLEK
jgi:predicted PurR-regulated permease PerM